MRFGCHSLLILGSAYVPLMHIMDGMQLSVMEGHGNTFDGRVSSLLFENMYVDGREFLFEEIYLYICEVCGIFLFVICLPLKSFGKYFL
jgi:hypothetical protein